jgi:hypothetical protein
MKSLPGYWIMVDLAVVWVCIGESG